jgi:hypothetical protein
MRFADPTTDVCGQEWFLTLFTSVAPLATAQFVWDWFIVDGWTAIHQTALALVGQVHGPSPRLAAGRPAESVSGLRAAELSQVTGMRLLQELQNLSSRPVRARLTGRGPFGCTHARGVNTHSQQLFERHTLINSAREFQVTAQLLYRLEGGGPCASR